MVIWKRVDYLRLAEEVDGVAARAGVKGDDPRLCAGRVYQSFMRVKHKRGGHGGGS